MNHQGHQERHKQKMNFALGFFKKNIFLNFAPLVLWWLVVFVLFRPATALAEEEKWIFLPVSPLFQPLVGDPREPQTNVMAYTSQNRLEGAIRTTLELLLYSA